MTPERLQKERKAVAVGAALLDRILPGWHNRINLEKLNMRNGSLCMMGQLFGTKVEGKLAREMYPEEVIAAQDAGDEGYYPNDGYCTALYAGVEGRLGGAVQAILRKLRLSRKMTNELQALKHVCGGHDNRCLWAEAIAERKAKDAAEKGETVSA